jgi:histidinol-phosphate aminotransferase
MASFKDRARRCIQNLAPFHPGPSFEEIESRFGPGGAAKLDSNENPLGPSPRALEAAAACLGRIHRYPESGSARLRGALARRYRLAPECVIIGSGSDELIDLLARAFLEPEDELVVSEHAFIRYRAAGSAMGARVVEVPMAAFRHDLVAMGQAVTPRTKLVFIANPNNPTGTYVSRADLAAFFERLPPAVLAVVDEAYFEYSSPLTDYPDSVAFFRDGRRNVVALRTFSKAHGLAGLRVGYGIADPSVVAQLDRIRLPFNLTIPSQAACEAALGDARHLDDSVALNLTNRSWFCEELKSRGIDFVPSAGNFVMLRTTRGGAAAFEALFQKGVIVRPMGGYGLPDHLRVTIGRKEELQRFLDHFLAFEGKR